LISVKERTFSTFQNNAPLHIDAFELMLFQRVDLFGCLPS
jgi:hypothetical protein